MSIKEKSRLTAILFLLAAAAGCATTKPIDSIPGQGTINRSIVELLTSQGSDEGRKVAEIIQANLREIGIGVEIRVLEWAAFLKEHIKKRRFEAVTMAWSIGLDPDPAAGFPHWVFHSVRGSVEPWGPSRRARAASRGRKSRYLGDSVSREPDEGRAVALCGGAAVLGRSA